MALKSHKRLCSVLNKNINFNKNETESNMENTTDAFRETNFVLLQNSKFKVVNCSVVWELWFYVLLSVLVWKKVTIDHNVSIADHAPGIRLPCGSKLAMNRKNTSDVKVFRDHVTVKFFERCCVSFVNFSYWSKFHVNIILKLWQFSFLRNWPGIRKSEITPSEFC